MSSKLSHINHGFNNKPLKNPKQKHISGIRKLVTIFNAANLIKESDLL